MKARVEVSGDKVQPHLIRCCDVEDHVGIRACKCTELRCEHRGGRQWRDDETHAPHRSIAQIRDLSERISDVCQRRIEAGDQLRAGVVSRCLTNQPVAEIVQCGEPLTSGLFRAHG